MAKKYMTWPILLHVVMSLTILLSACIGAAQPTSQSEQRNYPTVFITPLITQVIATRSAPTATPEEESTPTQIFAGSWDPLKASIYYPVRGCVASRLRIGDSAFVAYNGGLMGLYPTSDISFAPLLRRVQSGEAFLIVDGPWCEDNTLVWKVKTTNPEDDDLGVQNYVPEGNGEQYWLLPLESNPGIPTPKVKATQAISAYYIYLVHPKGCRFR